MEACGKILSEGIVFAAGGNMAFIVISWREDVSTWRRVLVDIARCQVSWYD